MKVPEQFRLTRHLLLGSTPGSGNNGFFIVPHPKVKNYVLSCMASDGLGWNHVSVTVSALNKQPARCPTWSEMCYIKDLFWHKDDCVIQYHPPESEYVNNHPFCLHLWQPIEIPLPIPDSLLVGIKAKIKLI